MLTGREGIVNGRRWRWCRNTQERQLKASAVVRARLGAAQSGLGRGLTALTGQGRLNLGHRLLSWQCECSDGSAVANGGSEQTAGATAAAEAGMRRATAGMAQEEYGEGEYEVTDWPTPSPLLIAKRGSQRAFSI